MPFITTKKYGHDRGLSCCFRQWRANDSHCHLLHGYSLAFEFTFGCNNLDERNWVVDFGGLKPLLQDLQHAFHHRLIVAADDPHRELLCSLTGRDIANVRVMSDLSMEKFAQHAYNLAVNRVAEMHPATETARNVWVMSCRVWEHEGNSAMFAPYVNGGTI